MGEGPPLCRCRDWGNPKRHILVQGHITYEKEEPGLKAVVSSELRPWRHPGLPQGRIMGTVGVTVPTHGLRVWLNSQKHRGSPGELCVRDLSNEPQKMTSLPGNRNQQIPEPRYPGLHSGEETKAVSLAAKMFCCLPPPRAQGLSRTHRQSVCNRCQRWLRAH